MAAINHVTLVVQELEPAAEFYEREFGLEPVAAFVFDYPTAFLKFTNGQQLHLTEWEDARSFRGHLCIEVEDFNAVFPRMKELGIIDVAPWGNVRQLPDGAMQMFVRDPSGNLIEITSSPTYKDQLDPAIFTDDLFVKGLYVSGRNDFRGYKAENATLYTGE